MPENRVGTEEQLHPTAFTINVFAFTDQGLKTHTDEVTDQGFGISTPLPTPETVNSTLYRWRGHLHPDTETTVFSTCPTPETLAENFALNSQDRQRPDLAKQGLPSYLFDYTPPEDQFTELTSARPDFANPDVLRVVRGLNEDEQKRFMAALAKANRTASRR
jgi:hypothetical protein